MKFKTITTTLPAVKIDMGGFPVKQALPTAKVAQVDPFLLLHHARVKPIYDRPAKIQGVGPHPHRGFSPVTFVIDGAVHHRDSRGNNQVAKKGEVQWINAGAGIIHSERPSQALVDSKGMQEIVQLWINTPARAKMQPPEYAFTSNADIALLASDQGLSEIKLVAGEYGEAKGKIKTASPLLILWVESQAGAIESFDIPEGFNTTVYVIKGDASVEQHGIVDPESLLVFSEAGNAIRLHAKSEVSYLVLAGEPLNEPLVQQGPFVMNTSTEILEAMRDYQMGKMGILIED